jgi:acyl-CoA synthetase (AMP-forming)/AMP-acid ligase II
LTAINPVTLGEQVAANGRLYSEQLAIIEAPNTVELIGRHPLRLTWSAYDQLIDRLVSGLRRAGLRMGDVFMVQLPNTAELCALYVAASRMGAVISPVAVQYSEFELRHFASIVSPKLMITTAAFREGELSARAKAIDLPCAVLDVVALEAEPLLNTRAEIDAPVEAKGDRLLTLCWTSGTTGQPKPVPRTETMWQVQARLTAEAAGYCMHERWLVPFPLINMAALGGFIFPAAQFAAELVLHHPLDPQLFLAQLKQEAVQFTVAPPPLLNKLAAAPEMWRSCGIESLRAIGSGSAPLATEMIRTFEENYGIPVINFYGSNEGIALYATPRDTPKIEHRAHLFAHREDSAATDFETQLRDPETGARVVDPEQAGELVIRGPGVFGGYLGVDNRDVFTRDGWFRTGDLLAIDADVPSHYRIVGRIKDIINRGGFKIAPDEIDGLLTRLPGVLEAAVCAVPDEVLGERLCVCIVPETHDDPPQLDDVISFLEGLGLARLKLPEFLAVVESLPRNPLGKLVRPQLSAQVAVQFETQG